jgi:hypothetical protein
MIDKRNIFRLDQIPEAGAGEAPKRHANDGVRGVEFKIEKARTTCSKEKVGLFMFDDKTA